MIPQPTQHVDDNDAWHCQGTRLRDPRECLCPGTIDTDFHSIFTKDEVHRNVEAASPVKRRGLPADVANLVLFLACEDSASITGANVNVNGGMLFS